MADWIIISLFQFETILGFPNLLNGWNGYSLPHVLIATQSFTSLLAERLLSFAPLLPLPHPLLPLPHPLLLHSLNIVSTLWVVPLYNYSILLAFYFRFGFALVVKLAESLLLLSFWNFHRISLIWRLFTIVQTLLS